MLDRSTDLRVLERNHYFDLPLTFTRGCKEKYVVFTPEYAYGVHASHAEDYQGDKSNSDKLHLWLPRTLVAIQGRWYLRRDTSLPNLKDNDPDSYMWLQLGVNGSFVRRETYIGRDLLQYEKGQNGFEIEIRSALPVDVFRVRHSENFKGAVLNRRPRR